MKRTSIPLLILFYILVIAGKSNARNADGTLGLLRTPNNGTPVILTAGNTFEVVLEGEAKLTLSGNAGTLGLDVAWSSLPGGLKRGQCAARMSLTPGFYTIHAETATGIDTNNRSVYVLDKFPESYQIAHITDLHIGGSSTPDTKTDLLQSVIETLNTSDAAFALITGDLTENGDPAEFQHVLELLDTCRMPTYVVAGNHDRKDNNYQKFFGPLPYAFLFGEDGYLAFDTKDFLIADEMREQNGLLHFYRRQLRAARWSIGFTHRYDIAMGIRTQLCLFVDDPLDYLFYGHYHRDPGEKDGIPWGNTRHILTPAAVDGMMRFVEIGPSNVKVLETTAPTAMETEGETY